MSVAVAKNETAAPAALVASFVMFPGTVSTGAVVSTTVTVKVLAMLILPVASFAVQDTVVVPTGNVEPLVGEQVTTGAGSTASAAVGGE